MSKIAYTGMEVYWKQRLSQGKYVLNDIKAKLYKSCYIDEAITESDYIELVAYAEQHVDSNYKPNATLESLQQENTELKSTVNNLTAIAIKLSMK